MIWSGAHLSGGGLYPKPAQKIIRTLARLLSAKSSRLENLPKAFGTMEAPMCSALPGQAKFSDLRCALSTIPATCQVQTSVQSLITSNLWQCQKTIRTLDE